MGSLFVLITGFGPPHWEHKMQILESNLEKICSYKWERITIKVCQYVSPRAYNLPATLLEKYPTLEVIYETGIVGEFIKRHANPVQLAPYDYVLLLLDDVELINIDFEKVIQYQKDLKLDIVSPTMTPDSKYQYPYLLQDNNPAQVKVTSVCEYFCMFFPLPSFRIYYQHITLDNPWMWGLDLVLHKHVGLTIGLLNEYTMKHWYKSECYAVRPDVNPAEGFHRCISRYGETADRLAEQRAVRYVVYYPSN